MPRSGPGWGAPPGGWAGVAAWLRSGLSFASASAGRAPPRGGPGVRQRGAPAPGRGAERRAGRSQSPAAAAASGRRAGLRADGCRLTAG